MNALIRHRFDNHIESLADQYLNLKSSSVVGLPGFEPGAPCSQSRCATKLRHNPYLYNVAEIVLVLHDDRTDGSDQRRREIAEINC